MERVLLLNYDYTYLATVSWKKAFKLLTKKKAEVIKYADGMVQAIETSYQMPKIIKLLYFIQKVHKTHMAYNRRVVFTRDNYTCCYCGSGDRLTIDHVTPKARGGKTTFENTATCCFSCNNKKGNKTPEEALMKLRKKPYAPTILEYMLKSAKVRMTELDDVLKDIFK